MIVFLPLLLSFAASTNNNWLSKRLDPYELQVHDFPETGRGLRTTRDRAPSEVLMQVMDAVTADTILQRYPRIGQAAGDAASSGSPLTDEQVLALGLLELRLEKDAYALTLPTHQYSVLTLPESLQSCLPRCYGESVDASKECTRQLYENVSRFMAPPLPPLEDFLWAFGTVRSRSISAEELPENPLLTGPLRRMMLPGFDILNHNDGVTASLELVVGSSTWQLTTQESYKAGDQVFLNYGGRDNVKFLFTYGFCYPSNTENLALFDLQDLLQACSIARPLVFTSRVLDMIRPQLEAVTGSGEERAMFSHDGTKQPRDSLQGGLNMMQQVSQQVTREKDDHLSDDITKCLIETRRVELSKGLTTIETIDASGGWNNVQKSIEILLQAEIDLLH